VYRDQVEERADLRGRTYYWIGGPADGFGDVPGSDLHAVRDRIASVTPLDLDLTHDGLLEQLPRWRLEGFEAAVAADLSREVREA
jgi:5'-nucleotidase